MYKVENTLILLSIHLLNSLHKESMLHEETTVLDDVVKNKEVKKAP